MKLRNGLIGGMTALAVISATAGAVLAEAQLSLTGTALPPVTIDAGGALEARVAVGTDEVSAVHAILRPASSNITLMRDRDGFWMTWDGDRASLIDSAARRDGDDLVFKIFQAPPQGVGSMTITIAYQTPDGLKYGWFDVAERAQ
ncbi:MAG: hypothetical protein AAF367_02435 [Pseudomonadota bacterium]